MCSCENVKNAMNDIEKKLATDDETSDDEN